MILLHTLTNFVNAEVGILFDLGAQFLRNAGLVQAMMHDVNFKGLTAFLHADSCVEMLYGPQDTTFCKAV